MSLWIKIRIKIRIRISSTTSTRDYATELPNSQSTSVSAIHSASTITNLSSLGSESMEICGSQEIVQIDDMKDSSPDTDDSAKAIDAAYEADDYIERHMASADAKPPAFVDNNDTITRFFSAASSTRDNDLHEAAASGIPERNTTKDDADQDDDGDVSMDIASEAQSTPVRRVLPVRKSTPRRVSIASPIETPDSVKSRVSKKKATPASVSSAVPIGLDLGSPIGVGSPLAVHFDAGSPITRSKSRAASVSAPASVSASASARRETTYSDASPLRHSLARKSISSAISVTSAEPPQFFTVPIARRSSMSAHKIEMPASIDPSPADENTEAQPTLQQQHLEQQQQQETLEIQGASESVETVATVPLEIQQDVGFINDHIGDEELLIDEHLSVVDSSFYQEPLLEAPPLQIATLADFLAHTGIEFHDKLAAQLRRDTTAFITGPSVPTDLDYVKAASIHLPELEIYEFGCRELAQYIAEGRESIEAVEAEVEVTAPLIFLEFAEGTLEEREEIKDKQFLDAIEASMTELHDSTATRFDELKEQLAALRTRQVGQRDMELAEQRHIEQLKSKDLQNSIDIDHLTKELEALKVQVAQECAALAIDEQTETELENAIAKAEELSKDLIVFDPEDLPHLRHEYKTVVLTHLWRPVEISLAQQVLVFDDVVQVAFIKQGDTFAISLSVANAVEDARRSNIATQSKVGFATLNIIGIENVQAMLAQYERLNPVCRNWADMKRVLDDTAYSWENIKTLVREVEQTRCICPQIEILAQPSQGFWITTRCTFFSFTRKIRFSIDFGFGKTDDGIFHYPCGAASTRFVSHYGSVSAENVVQVLGSVEPYLFELCSQAHSLVA
eukprot:jgi/Hompol1/5854/HPOL_001025-RA